MSLEEQDKKIGTTGHDWDGIQELNNPTPRWWLIVWMLTVVWSIGYWVIYPAWPTLSGEGERGGTVGSQGWTQYKELAESQQEINARRAVYQSKFDQATYAEIMTDQALYTFALAGGKAAFGDNCATCHGTGGAGAPGYPNLNDDDWLWGGTPAVIEETIKFGIRGQHEDTRFSDMPAFADMLDGDEISAVANHVLSLSGKAAATEKGAQVYADNCAACHGDNGRGMRDLGAPNLADAIWFYGDSHADLVAQIQKPQQGVMPSWSGRLSESTIRQLTLYVHSLGGGE